MWQRIHAPARSGRQWLRLVVNLRDRVPPFLLSCWAFARGTWRGKERERSARESRGELAVYSIIVIYFSNTNTGRPSERVCAVPDGAPASARKSPETQQTPWESLARLPRRVSSHDVRATFATNETNEPTDE
jgi:hypothetical protein